MARRRLHARFATELARTRPSVLAPTCLSAALATLASSCGSTPSPAATHRPRAFVREVPFEIASSKPWVGVRIGGSAPQAFILDTGCRGSSVIARECAARLHLVLGDEEEASVGAGEGVRVGISTTNDVVLDVGGDTFAAPALPVFPLDHVEPCAASRSCATTSAATCDSRCGAWCDVALRRDQSPGTPSSAERPPSTRYVRAQ